MSAKATTWRALWRLIRFRPWHYLGTDVSILSTSLGYALPVLAIREILDLMSEDASARWDFWTLIAFVAGCGLARVAGQVGTAFTFNTFMYSVFTLLQRNVLDRVFQQPGAAALADSPSGLLSRLQGDVQEMVQVPWWLHQVVHGTLMAALAVGVMLTTDVMITVVVLVPMLIVVHLTERASGRIAR